MGNEQSSTRSRDAKFDTSLPNRSVSIISGAGSNRRHSHVPTTATPPAGEPPPYTQVDPSPIATEPEQIPPPVPPRNRRSSAAPGANARSASGGSANSGGQRLAPPTSHRRVASHTPQPTRLAATSQQSRSPGDNVGGFRAQLSAPNLGSSHTRVASVPPPRNQGSSDSQTARAPLATVPERRNSKEDALLLLKKYDTVIVVDDSSSMAGALWWEARNALSGVAEIAGQYDEDGIDVCFLNDRRIGSNLRTAREVERLFDRVSPDAGMTPTGERLEELLLDYLERAEQAMEEHRLSDVKPVNIIVITDGAPTDDPETVIVQAARRLDSRNFPINQVGIQFVQIGCDPKATEALQELDDDLSGTHGIRDIVDTTLYTGAEITAELLTKILLGGVNRRVDKRGAAAVM